MNCSLAIGLLPDLLLFLSNYAEIRGVVVHADPICAVRAKRSFDYLVPWWGNLEEDSRLVHVFFPGIYSKVPMQFIC